jgi:deazaflavin-dependent oxidoreductase (nitroreductase family)
MTDRYIRPNWFTQRIFNPIVAGLTKIGISVWGSRVLAVRGRSSGQMRTTPVNVLTVDGQRYLVAPRGETNWVKNLRVAGVCELRVGRRTEKVSATELDDARKPAVIRPYLRRWKWEVGQFFEGVGSDASDDELLEVAGRYPVFALS